MGTQTETKVKKPLTPKAAKHAAERMVGAVVSKLPKAPGRVAKPEFGWAKAIAEVDADAEIKSGRALLSFWDEAANVKRLADSQHAKVGLVIQAAYVEGKKGRSAQGGLTSLAGKLGFEIAEKDDDGNEIDPTRKASFVTAWLQALGKSASRDYVASMVVLLDRCGRAAAARYEVKYPSFSRGKRDKKATSARGLNVVIEETVGGEKVNVAYQYRDLMTPAELSKVFAGMYDELGHSGIARFLNWTLTERAKTAEAVNQIFSEIIPKIRGIMAAAA